MEKNATAEQKTKLTGPKYWKSLDEYSDTPEFKKWIENEFPQGASEAFGVNRRNFMKIMGASFAFAGFGLSGCRRPERKIIPYAKQPENMIPGVPKYFATSMPSGSDALPLIVETHMARPTKIEGNANFEPYGGATNTFAQASILDLYDPDRSQQNFSASQPISKAAAKDILLGINAKFAKSNGKGLAFLVDGSNSPTRARLLKKIRKSMPNAVVAEYDPIDSAKPEKALKAASGKRLRANYHFDKAKRILSLDSDFIQSGDGAVGNARGWAKSRKVTSSKDATKMNRLYQVESDFTVTGGMADHRLRLSSAQIPAFFAGIAAEIIRQDGDKSLASKLQKAFASIDLEDKDKWVKECAADLRKNKGKAAVVAGSHLSDEVHQLVYLINDLLGARGKTVDYLIAPDEGYIDIRELAEAINSASVETLVILNGNPVYNAPADLNWTDVQKNVPEVVRYGYYFDETSEIANTHIAATHYLESWNDGRTWEGTMVPVQPMIHPIFEDCLMQLEFLAAIAGVATDPYGLVKETLLTRILELNKEKAFDRYLHRGFLPGSGHTAFKSDIPAAAFASSAAGISSKTPPTQNSLEVRIVPSQQVKDGRYSNNGWLQEMPEPMNKTTWENTINVSPKLAQDLDIKVHNVSLNSLLSSAPKVSATTANTHEAGREISPIGRLTVNGVTIEGPINIQPGLADYTITVAMGYGRTFGRVAEGCGFNVFSIWNELAGGISEGAKLEVTDEKVEVANTQQHWSMEGRAIIREANAEHYAKHPDFAHHMGVESHSPPIYGKDQDKSLKYKVTEQPQGASLYKTPKFGNPQQWGMSIDMNACTGCNQCVIACQSENNIPVVGKDQVKNGREMHWMRIDRYYMSGNYEENKSVIPEDPQVSMQPMLCQQCEMAPCEQVCPVNATVHDDQGLNVMAYNRCVGTRYCSNNCPYKVRRFNFFDWNKRSSEKVDLPIVGETTEYYIGPFGKNKNETQGGKLKEMVQNPDVTVRMRGVMEKCTFCQQRIEEAKINQKAKAGASANIKVPDGVIKTACEQCCPTDAISFGDLADENTATYKLKQEDRDYSVLGYLNVRPRTTYLARLRNPNSKMPDYHKMPLSTMEYDEASGHGGDHGEGHDAHSTNGHGDHSGHDHDDHKGHDHH